MSFPKKLLMPLLLAATCLFAGCSNQQNADPETDNRTSTLRAIHDVYSQFAKENQRPPAALGDVSTMKYENVNPGALNGIKSGRYLVVWGLDIHGKDSGKVLAYEKDGYANGGWVILGDGTVKNMSADALQNALKR